MFINISSFDFYAEIFIILIIMEAFFNSRINVNSKKVLVRREQFLSAIQVISCVEQIQPASGAESAQKL